MTSDFHVFYYPANEASLSDFLFPVRFTPDQPPTDSRSLTASSLSAPVSRRLGPG